jgi:hypothetical protein
MPENKTRKNLREIFSGKISAKKSGEKIQPLKPGKSGRKF